MGIELFVFDWSGVISDDRKPVYEAIIRILKEKGHPGMTFDEWLPQTKLTASEFLESQGVNIDPQEASLLYKKYLDEAIVSGIKPVVYPDVQETLAYLRDEGKLLAVLSSHPSENLLNESKEYNINDYFNLISGNSKNKVNGLLSMINKFGVPYEKVLYTGDTVFDIKAAKGAGIKSAGISGHDDEQRGYHSRKRLAAESPDFLLYFLKDLMDEKFL